MNTRIFAFSIYTTFDFRMLLDFQMVLSTRENMANFIGIWTCCFCEADFFETFFEWSMHLLSTHISNNEALHCTQHNQYFGFIHEFARHFWSEHLHVFYVCRNCESTYDSMNDILHHLEHCRHYLTSCVDCELMPCVCTNEE